MEEPDYLPPGVRRTVRANTGTTNEDLDGSADHASRDNNYSPLNVDRETDGAQPRPLPTLRRNETYDSITTSIGDEEMEYYGWSPEGAAASAGYSPHAVGRFRRKLRFFFMNPYEKWKAKRKFPWKLVVQLVKVVLATVQLSSFGFSRSSHVNFMEKSSIAFKHLYLKDWNPSYETLPYPPATGVYAIYTIPDFYASINNVMMKHNMTEEIAIGTYRFSSKHPVNLCNTHYRKGEIPSGNGRNDSYDYNSEKVRDCIPLAPVWKRNGTTNEDELVYDVREFLAENNRSINFDSVIRIELLFSLKTVHLKALAKHDKPDCYIFNIRILYENKEHDGQMQVTLVADETPLKCIGRVAYPTDEQTLIIVGSVFDTCIILVCIGSFVLCVRSIYRAQKLRLETVKFFRKQFGCELTYSEQMEFVDLWYLLIIINDILTVIGSVVKILIDNKAANSYEICSTTLGTASLLVWFGVLRYLGFFEKYNVLILTLKKSAPNVLRFLLCAIVFYLGFAFCGWVVLGPYHMKFRQISTASECLFSLVNGDDMFVTFSIIGNNQNSYVWYYSRIYLYIFISLFIYVVLSVFISVIMDAYETIKYFYEHGFPKSELMKFVEGCPEDASSPLYRSDEPQKGWSARGVFSKLGCCGVAHCCQRGTQETSEASDDENSPLLRH